MSDDERRRGLERSAYDADATPAERAEAQRQLGELVRTAVTPAATERPERAHQADPGAETAAQGVAATDDEPDGEGSARTTHTPPARRRLLLVGALAGALVVGLLAGAGITAVTRGGSSSQGAAEADSASSTPGPNTFQGLIQTQPTKDVTVDPAQGSRLADGDPAVTPTDSSDGALAAANALLSRPATDIDKYPLAVSTDDAYVDASIRLVATSANGLKFFIGRMRGTDGGYCLLEANAAGSLADGSVGTSTCSAKSDFAATGMSMTSDRFSMTWTAGEVAVELIGNGSASG